MEIGTFEKQIAKINVKADMKYLRPVLEFIRSFAETEGFSSENASLLEVAAEEACVNVIEHAYAPGDNGDFDVTLALGPRQFVISIEDRGLPADLKEIEKNDQKHLGVMLMKSIADETVFQNLGERGKCVKIIKNLPGRFHKPEEAAADITRPDDKKQTAGPVEIRFMNSEEAAKLSRCIYRAYGYTYIGTFYYPEQIAEMINSKILKSVVAVDRNGEIVAHLGIKFPFPGARIAETAQAAVSPEYRGMHLFEDMKKFSARFASESGIYGLYSESVTIHPYTQKGNIALGAKETGFVLAFIPEKTVFKKISEEGGSSNRQAALLFYMKTLNGPRREVYVPARHDEMITKIYEHNQLERTFLHPENIAPPKNSELDINFSAHLNAAFILVNSIGSDFETVLKNYRRQLCEKHADCIYLYIPLSSPCAPAACVICENSGFSFAGIIPEYFSGDCIVFQYLNNVRVEPEKICAVSDFAKSLLNYIINEYNDSKKK